MSEYKKPEVVEIAVCELIPFAANARSHDDNQVAQIAASIREFGWTSPILVQPDKTIIAGHGRLAAARKLRMDRVPCIVLDGLTPAQVRALVIADNKLALNAGWDEELLASELQGIVAADEVDMMAIGFSEEELAMIMQSSAAQEEIVDNGPMKGAMEVVVSFQTEHDQRKFYDRMTAEGYSCRVLSM